MGANLNVCLSSSSNSIYDSRSNTWHSRKNNESTEEKKSSQITTKKDNQVSENKSVTAVVGQALGALSPAAQIPLSPASQNPLSPADQRLIEKLPRDVFLYMFKLPSLFNPEQLLKLRLVSKKFNQIFNHGDLTKALAEKLNFPKEASPDDIQAVIKAAALGLSKPGDSFDMCRKLVNTYWQSRKEVVVVKKGEKKIIINWNIIDFLNNPYNQQTKLDEQFGKHPFLNRLKKEGRYNKSGIVEGTPVTLPPIELFGKNKYPRSAVLDNIIPPVLDKLPDGAWASYGSIASPHTSYFLQSSKKYTQDLDPNLQYSL